MEIVALIVAVLAIIIAYLAWARASSLKERLDLAQSAVAELRAAVKTAGEASEEKLAELRLAVRSQAGEAIFSPEMTIAEAMEVHPRVNDVLASFHLGGCSHCAVSDVDTIKGACQTYGIDQAALMTALNGLVTGASGGAVSGVQNPNVKVGF